MMENSKKRMNDTGDTMVKRLRICHKFFKT